MQKPLQLQHCFKKNLEKWYWFHIRKESLKVLRPRNPFPCVRPARLFFCKWEQRPILASQGTGHRYLPYKLKEYFSFQRDDLPFSASSSAFDNVSKSKGFGTKPAAPCFKSSFAGPLAA